jgi:hypothetical protein
MTLSRAAVLALGLLVLAAGLAGCGKAAPVTYSDKEGAFTITYPADWRKLPGGSGEDLKIIPAEQSDASATRDTLMVRAETLEKPMALDAFFDVKAKAAEAADASMELKVAEKTSVTLGGQEARRMVFSMAGRGGRVTYLAWFLVKGDRGYAVQASALSSRFDTVKPQFEEIAGTFKAE